MRSAIKGWLGAGFALVAAFALALGISAEAQPQAPPKQPQIKFGLAGPFTGQNASFGAQLKNGAEQAIADINAAGGILKQKIGVSVGDDASDARQGVSVANKFATAGVQFVIGHFNSGVTIPA